MSLCENMKFSVYLVVTILWVVLTSGFAEAQAVIKEPKKPFSLRQRDFKIGIGPIPRNFPGSSQQDFLDMFDKIKEVAELVIAQNEWRDSGAKSGDIPEYLMLLGIQKETYHYESVFGINFFQGEGKAILNMSDNPVNDWTNEEAKDKYRNVALEIIRRYNPKYLGLAIEVNTYYQYHPEDFERFVQAYKQIYDEIKIIYPDIKLFVSFQLERMKGIGKKYFGQTIAPHWHLIDTFGDKLDLVAFTTYPELEYGSPAEIPEDYYLEIKKYTDKPIAFTEIGWSAKSRIDESQIKFISKFMALTNTLNKEFVAWVFMHDLKTPGPLTKVGLRNSKGFPKKSWFLWKRIKVLPYRNKVLDE